LDLTYIFFAILFVEKMFVLHDLAFQQHILFFTSRFESG